MARWIDSLLLAPRFHAFLVCLIQMDVVRDLECALHENDKYEQSMIKARLDHIKVNKVEPTRGDDYDVGGNYRPVRVG
jgi:hypothetical protein